MTYWMNGCSIASDIKTGTVTLFIRTVEIIVNVRIIVIFIYYKHIIAYVQTWLN